MNIYLSRVEKKSLIIVSITIIARSSLQRWQPRYAIRVPHWHSTWEDLPPPTASVYRVLLVKNRKIVRAHEVNSHWLTEEICSCILDKESSIVSKLALLSSTFTDLCSVVWKTKCIETTTWIKVLLHMKMQLQKNANVRTRASGKSGWGTSNSEKTCESQKQKLANARYFWSQVCCVFAMWVSHKKTPKWIHVSFTQWRLPFIKSFL